MWQKFKVVYREGKPHAVSSVHLGNGGEVRQIARVQDGETAHEALERLDAQAKETLSRRLVEG